MKKKNKKNKELLQPLPGQASACTSSVAETPGAARDDSEGEASPKVGKIAPVVRPLTMAERRARKAEVRAARIEAALLKREAAARDARLKELDLQDDSRKFMVKVSKSLRGLSERVGRRCRQGHDVGMCFVVVAFLW